MTALHIAVCHEQTEFTEKLLELMPPDALEMQDAGFYTPLHYASMSRNIRIARALVRKNPALPQIADVNSNTPLWSAAVTATEHKELVWYLTNVTKDEPPSYPFTGQWAGDLICALTAAGFHDISLLLLDMYPTLITAKATNGHDLLKVLASEPSNFESGSRFSFWERLIYQIVPADREAPIRYGNYARLRISMRLKIYLAQVISSLHFPVTMSVWVKLTSVLRILLPYRGYEVVIWASQLAPSS
ncbi:uncharacterized protein LOC119998453 isoform X2 [Tripterygium wilfordii]|uniref:uncharacterized protein LOC119998453 isoform X2 n=1 Tax=Tripterygium wilfordii TaxID=458696 RepID=UPI0018F855DD|nr:uncharacterized protein LOC119998453 isoform X2 [Tripterygium wilfordii]